jgi:hypothetical protein
MCLIEKQFADVMTNDECALWLGQLRASRPAELVMSDELRYELDHTVVLMEDDVENFTDSDDDLVDAIQK